MALLAVTLPAQAAADVPLGAPLSVPLNGTSTFSPTLTAGTTYRVVVTGTVTQPASDVSVSVSSDALRCIAQAGLQIPCGPSHLVIRSEGDPSQPGLDDLNPAAALPFDAISHRYEDTFTAARTGRLEAFVKPLSPGPTFQGGFTLALYGPPGAGSTPGGGGGVPGGTGSPQLLAAAAAWGQVGPATALAPGGQLITGSPPIARGQRGVTVTLKGDTSGETAIVFGTPTNRVGGRPTGGDCVRAAVGFAQAAREQELDGSVAFVPGEGLVYVPKDTSVDEWLAFTHFMIVCLDLLNKQDQKAHQAALIPGAGAARVSCRPHFRAVNMRVDDVAHTIKYRTRRAKRREPVRKLLASCRKARNGTLKLSIRTRSRRIKLRKVVGKHLVVGAYRAAAASGTANVQATFKR